MQALDSVFLFPSPFRMLYYVPTEPLLHRIAGAVSLSVSALVHQFTDGNGDVLFGAA